MNSYIRRPPLQRWAHLTPELLAVLYELDDRWPKASGQQLALAFADRTGRVINPTTALKWRQQRRREQVAETVQVAPDAPGGSEFQNILGSQPGSPTER